MQNQTVKAVCEVIADVLEIEPEDIDMESKLVSDLGADSLDIIDLSYSLGKQLKISMPQKSVMMHAEEMFGSAELLVNDGYLTQHGALLLQTGPNQYSPDEAAEGMTLHQIFSDTKVRHWVNLCDSIVKSGTTGDQLIKQKIQSYQDVA